MAFFPDDGNQTLLAIMSLGSVWWQVDHADPVLTRSGQADIQSPTGCAQEAMGELEEHACPIARAFFTATCPTMIQIDQNG